MAPTTRSCYRCEEIRPESDFTCGIDHAGFAKCRVCVAEIEAAKDAPRERNTATHRNCYMCARFLPVERFTRRANGTYFSACKACNKHVFGPRQRAKRAAAKTSA